MAEAIQFLYFLAMWDDAKHLIKPTPGAAIPVSRRHRWKNKSVYQKLLLAWMTKHLKCLWKGTYCNSKEFRN